MNYMEDAFTGAEFGDLHQNWRVYLVLTTGIIGKAAWEDTAFQYGSCGCRQCTKQHEAVRLLHSGAFCYLASLIVLIINGLPCQQHITPYAIHCVHLQDLRHTYMIAYSFSRSITFS